MQGQLQPFLPCFITLIMIQCFHWQQLTGNNCPAMRTKARACPWNDRSQNRCCKNWFHPQMLTKAFTSKCHIYNIQNWLDWTVFIFSSVVVSLTSVHDHTLYHKISTSAKTLITMIVLEVLGQKATDSMLQQCCLLTLHIWHPLDESASTGFH